MIIVTLQTSTQYTLNVKTLYLLGFYYLFQIGTEQPLFFALLISKLDVEWINQLIPMKYHARLFYFSSIWHYLTKISTTIIILYIFISSLDDCDIFYIYNVSYKEWLQKNNDPDWGEVTQIVMFTLIPTLFILQMYQGVVFWRIGSGRKLESQMSRHSLDVPGDELDTVSPTDFSEPAKKEQS